MSEALLGLLVGVGLAAACGFRVFVPPFIASLAANAGYLAPGAGFEWLATPEVAWIFGIATLLEVLAYYVPWLDNALDALAAPAAVVAGILLTAAMAGDLAPWFRWALALIAGGGTAGAVHAMTGTVRLASTTTTGGVGNPVLATLEWIASATVAAASLVVPVVVVAALVGALLAGGVWLARRRRAGRVGVG